MCGIAGSSNFEKAFNLYKLNLHRGSYSTGFMAVCRNSKSYFIHKLPGHLTDTDFENYQYKLALSNQPYDYFLFHSRAPTNSTETKWSDKTTHPFDQDGCFVAHNGIITNFEEINSNPPFEVDSQMIPHDLIKNYSISKTYSNYQGLLTSWIVWDGEVYVVKAGSSLWMDKDSFSSSQFQDSTCVEEDGIWFKLKEGSFSKEGTFSYESPYFI